MKPPASFWRLLKHELTLGHFGGAGQAAFALFSYWIGIGIFPLLVLFGENAAQGNIASMFDAEFLPIIAILFLGVLTIWAAYAMVPGFGEILSSGGSVPGAVQAAALEFLFTRAVDRRILFRARAAAFFLFALTPFFLNVAVSPFAPAIRFEPADSASAETVERHTQYLKAFPPSHPPASSMPPLHSTNRNFNSNPLAASAEITSPLPMAIPHGTVAYTAWLAWSGTLAVLLLQGYAALIARCVNPNRWWTALLPGMPMFLLLSWLILRARGLLSPHVRIYESSFLFFSTHPQTMIIALAGFAAVVQTWCERRFSELEIP